MDRAARHAPRSSEQPRQRVVYERDELCRCGDCLQRVQRPGLLRGVERDELDGRTGAAHSGKQQRSVLGPRPPVGRSASRSATPPRRPATRSRRMCSSGTDRGGRSSRRRAVESWPTVSCSACRVRRRRSVSRWEVRTMGRSRRSGTALRGRSSGARVRMGRETSSTRSRAAIHRAARRWELAGVADNKHSPKHGPERSSLPSRTRHRRCRTRSSRECHAPPPSGAPLLAAKSRTSRTRPRLH